MKPNIRLSVIMAVFNEAKSVDEAIRNVLNVRIDGIEIGLCIVESNSTDGTREIVEKYKDHERVTLLLQDKPRGKGNAVREGLRTAIGDIFLIQDADNEYDVSDYEKLLLPIIEGKSNFVLGTRHVAGRPMRSFGRRGMRSGLLNLAHKVFTGLFNFVYRTKLTDPFTMYKVFTRDSIEGLHFEADRFDFDWELVAKLVRNGQAPIEIPINYVSRGFEDGKKVRFFRDPLTWIVALIKFRFVRIK